MQKQTRLPWCFASRARMLLPTQRPSRAAATDHGADGPDERLNAARSHFKGPSQEQGAPRPVSDLGRAQCGLIRQLGPRLGLGERDRGKDWGLSFFFCFVSPAGCLPTPRRLRQAQPARQTVGAASWTNPPPWQFRGRLKVVQSPCQIWFISSVLYHTLLRDTSSRHVCDRSPESESATQRGTRRVVMRAVLSVAQNSHTCKCRKGKIDSDGACLQPK